MRATILGLVIAIAGCTHVPRAPYYTPIYSEVTGSFVAVPRCDGIPLVDSRRRIVGCLTLSRERD